MVPRPEYRRANELRELGESARRRHDIVDALRHYEEASNLLRNSPDRLKFAHTVRHLGDVYAEQREWLRAEPCYIEALEVYRSHPSPSKLDVANAIRPYAILLSATGRHAESRGLFAEAARLYEAVGIAAGVEECMRRAGIQMDNAEE